MLQKHQEQFRQHIRQKKLFQKIQEKRRRIAQLNEQEALQKQQQFFCFTQENDYILKVMQSIQQKNKLTFLQNLSDLNNQIHQIRNQQILVKFDPQLNFFLQQITEIYFQDDLSLNDEILVISFFQVALQNELLSFLYKQPIFVEKFINILNQQSLSSQIKSQIFNILINVSKIKDSEQYLKDQQILHFLQDYGNYYLYLKLLLALVDSYRFFDYQPLIPIINESLSKSDAKLDQLVYEIFNKLVLKARDHEILQIYETNIDFDQLLVLDQDSKIFWSLFQLLQNMIELSELESLQVNLQILSKIIIISQQLLRANVHQVLLQLSKSQNIYLINSTFYVLSRFLSRFSLTTDQIVKELNLINYLCDNIKFFSENNDVKTQLFYCLYHALLKMDDHNEVLNYILELDLIKVLLYFSTDNIDQELLYAQLSLIEILTSFRYENDFINNYFENHMIGIEEYLENIEQQNIESTINDCIYRIYEQNFSKNY